MKRLRRGTVFSESRQLLEVFQRHGFELYDVSDTRKGTEVSWSDIEQLSPAEEFVIGKMYLFVPIPENGETPRDAYGKTEGLGPCLKIDNPADDRWVTLRVRPYNPCHLAVFTRLDFDPKFLVAFTFETPATECIVGIDYEQVVDTFKKYFQVITFEEFSQALQLAQGHSGVVTVA